MSAGRPGRARAFTSLAVLIVVGSAMLVATGMLFVIQAESAGTVVSVEQAQGRALAWSGLQAVVADLEDQRDLILDGRTPRLDRELVIYEAGGRRGVVRLLPVTPDGAVLRAEAGCLDLGPVTAEALVATGLVDEPTAEAIVRHRDARGRYRSVDELLEVDGVTPELLHGPLEDLGVLDDARGDAGDLDERVAGRLSGDAARGLADAVTTFAFGPTLRRDGGACVDVAAAPSDERTARLEEAFPDPADAPVRGTLATRAVTSDASLVGLLGGLELEPAAWARVLDAVTTEPERYAFGRLDLNTAPREALLTVPGLEPEQVDRIVRARDTLTDDEAATTTWPVTRGIVAPEAFASLAGRVTTRSWTWRVRLAAAEVRDDALDAIDAFAEPAPTPWIVWEAVIDLADTPPRVAELRDVTLLDLAAALALEMPEPEDEPASEDEVDGPGGEPDDDARDADDAGDADAAPTTGPDRDPGPGAATPAPPEPPAERGRPGRWTTAD
ncbi:MAG: helix-hairpin-helix domain-containing protein [Planctomycetota bacterium]